MKTAAVFFAALAAAALAYAAPAQASPPRSGIVHVHVAPGTPLRELGRQLFGGNCVTCHGPNGGGILHAPPGAGAGAVKGLGPSLRGVGALSANFYLRTGYMPLARPDEQPRRSRVLFSEHEIRAIVAYVASLGQGPAIPTPHPERGNVADGFTVFEQNCAGCHQIAAQGGYVTGAVAPPLQRASPQEIAEAVRIGPYLMPVFSPRQIGPRQLDSLVAYVQQTQHPTDTGGWAIGNIGPVPEGLVTWGIAIFALLGTCVAIGRGLRA